MAKIIIACSKKPLAAFIETELVSCDVDCRIAVDAVQLMTLVVEFKPDVLLFDSAFPSSDESLTLLGELRSNSPKTPIVGIFEPFEDDQDGVRESFPSENILALPFAGDDLRERLKQAADLEITKKSVVQDLEEDEEMAKPQAVPVEVFELTEIIEEGLPLDEIPGIDDGKASEFLLDVASDEAEMVDAESKGEILDDLELDGFSDTLDDFDSDFVESAGVEPDGDKVGDAGFGAVVEESLEVQPEEENIIESVAAEDSAEFVAGDTDALLADDDFTEVEIPELPENNDPVLAELKSAGLTAEHEIMASKSETASLATEEFGGEDDFGDDELGSIDDLLDEISIEEESAVESLAESGVEKSENSEKEDVGQDSGVEFSELIIPKVEVDPEVATVGDEEVLPDDGDELFLESAQSPEGLDVDETSESGLVSGDADLVTEVHAEKVLSADPEKAFAGDIAAPVETDIELPEDYLLEEEMPEFMVESEPEPEPESEARTLTSTASLSLAAEQPEICAEPISPDFSKQIESMTQEWSKQLLQSTYASMDKMIKAIGDLAPTIVDQVAREVIPPLAEKVIKAEIARLEEKLESEEESGKMMNDE